MEFLTQIFDTIYENFFDPRKRVFVGYLFSAIVIAFLWLCFVKKKTLKECFYNIFDKKIFFSKSAKADYILFLFNIIILMFLSPILITQLAIASVIFESLHFQTYLVPINTDIKYLWLIPYFFTVSYFVLDDLTKFITHALMHRIPLLWEIHKTHHSARVLTPITMEDCFISFCELISETIYKFFISVASIPKLFFIDSLILSIHRLDHFALI